MLYYLLLHGRCLFVYFPAWHVVLLVSSWPNAFNLGLSYSFLGPVHTYPNIFESLTFSFRIRLPSTRIRRIRQRIRIFLLRVDGKIFESGKKKLGIQKYPDTCRRSLTWHVLVVAPQPMFSSYTLLVATMSSFISITFQHSRDDVVICCLIVSV